MVATVYKWRKKTGARGPVIIDLLRMGGGRSDIRQPNCKEQGNCTCLSWPRKGGEYPEQKC